MKRMRILGLALVAVFALGAITVASASATPAFYECKKESSKTEGKFSKGCTAAGTGYELAPGVGSKGKGFKSSGANAHLEVVVPPGVSKEFEGGATIKIECTSNKGVGSDVLPNKVDKVKTTFKGCSTLGNPCQSGSKKGEIITNELAGELVDTEYGVGQVLGPETGLTSATFTCTGIATTNVHGSLIGLVKGDVNTISKESETEFIVGPGLGAVPYVAENSKKETKISTYVPTVNVPTDKLGGVPGEHFLDSAIEKEGKPQGELPSGQVQVVKNKGEAIEIKAP